jgi:hypothetical protein
LFHAYELSSRQHNQVSALLRDHVYDVRQACPSLTCGHSAYSNYFTQLNHSSFMDTALDLDLVDCTSLYASLEAFSLANTLSGLYKFLCSELNMRAENDSAGDMPTASFCSSFFNSPEFPHLVSNFIFSCI